MSKAQYYPRTLKILLSDYGAGLVTIPGLIVEYVRIKFAPGWKVSLSPKKVCEELGIKLGSFYRAIALIIKKKLITRAIHILREEKILNTSPSLLVNEEYVVNEKSEDDRENPIHESVKKIHNNQNLIHESVKNIHNSENKIHKYVKNEPENTSKTNKQSESPYISSNSYSKFISNLSPSEREKFFEFCKRRTDSFEIPLRCSLNTFLAAKNKQTGVSYFAEFWELYKKEENVVLNHTNENNATGMKPNFQKWYYWMNQLGIMVSKSERDGEIYVWDNMNVKKSFTEWLKRHSMEQAKQRFDASNNWGR